MCHQRLAFVDEDLSNAIAMRPAIEPTLSQDLKASLAAGVWVSKSMGRMAFRSSRQCNNVSKLPPCCSFLSEA